MIDFNRLTNKAQGIVYTAQQIVLKYKNPQIEPIHILLAIIENQEGINKDYVTELHLDKCVQNIINTIMSLPQIQNPMNSQQLFISQATSDLFDGALKEAQNLKDSYISVEHILLSMCEIKGTAEILVQNKINKNVILNTMKKIRGNKKVDSKNAEDQYKALEKYSTDLTQLAKKGKLDPVIGRDEEVRRIIQVLNRKSKNNPVLIGEPGVGKTAIV